MKPAGKKCLEVSGLTKRFGSHTAVDAIGFELGEGEILGLLGVNGAGKTTTIQMLLGILSPTAGTIRYFGKDFPEHREEILENVNFSSTYTSLPYNLTVKECLTFISYFYDIQNASERLARIADLFRLEKLLAEKISDLSAGQLTRVNLAKALINSPKILLLDEPTASLDPEVAAYIRKFLLEERRAAGTSIILTSHNMAEVEQVCDRVIFIHNGKIIANDTPERLAGSLRVSRMELYVPVPEIEARLLAYCRRRQLAHTASGGRISIELAQDRIAAFLQELAAEGIDYAEISIEKPGLEDYFLKVATVTAASYQEN